MEEKMQNNSKEGVPKELDKKEMAKLLDTIKPDSPKQQKTRKVKIYDFKRPDKFSKEQIVTIYIIHKTFARLVTALLSNRLRMEVQVKAAAVDQLTYDEFIKSIPNPSVLGVINMAPIKGNIVLEFDPGISSSIIDRVFGGKGKSLNRKRDISDTEISAMEQIIGSMLNPLSESWATIINITPELKSIESNPYFTMIVPPTDMAILVSFEVSIGDVKEYMNLCIPYLTLEPILSKLSARYIYGFQKKRGSSLAGKDIIRNMKVESEIFYKAEKLALRNLGSITKNTLIHIPDYKSGKAILRAGGESVLNLKRRDKGGNLYFNLSENTKDPVEDTGYLFPGTPATENTGDVIKKSFEQLTDYFNDGIKTLSKRITGIENNQNEISDQIYFESSDNSKPDIPRISYPDKPFNFVTAEDAESISTILLPDHPQVAALVLSYLDTGIAAEILKNLPKNLQIDVAERIAVLDRTAPEVLGMVERIMENKLNTMKTTIYRVGGIEAITDILGISSASVERAVVEGLEKTNPEIAEDIKKHMFVFEDIILLDDNAVKEMIKNCNRNDLLISIKTVSDKVKELLFRNMKKTELEQFKIDLEGIGRRRLTEVDSAQQRIILVLRELEEAGAIIVARPEQVVD